MHNEEIEHLAASAYATFRKEEAEKRGIKDPGNYTWLAHYEGFRAGLKADEAAAYET